MLGAKEYLATLKPVKKPVVLKVIAKGPTLTWDLDVMAAALDISRDLIGALVSDGRYANPIVALWLASHGFDKEKDGASGFILVSKRTGARYRLRIAVDSLSVAASNTKGKGRDHDKVQQKKELDKADGFAVAFTSEMPKAPIYFLSKSFIALLKDKGMMTDKDSGASKPILAYIKECLKEAAVVSANKAA